MKYSLSELPKETLEVMSVAVDALIKVSKRQDTEQIREAQRLQVGIKEAQRYQAMKADMVRNHREAAKHYQ